MTKGTGGYNGAKIVSSINGVGRTGLVPAKKNETRTPTYTIHQNKLKMDKVSHDTMKVLEENIGKKISDIPCSNIFATISFRAREIKEKINKINF